MTEEHLRYLNSMIREELKVSKSPDPGDIATAVVADLTPAMIRGIIWDLVRDRVRTFIHIQRSPAVGEHPVAPAPKSAKWDEVKRNILEDRYYVEGEWKFLGDLTIDDCYRVAEDYRKRAKTEMARADQFDALAGELRKKKAKTVSGLDLTKVIDIMDR